MKRFYWTIFLSLVLFFMYASLASAQTPRPTPTTVPSITATASAPTSSSNENTNGSIRGTIYQDQDQDGRCAAGDPVLTDIPIQFVSNDGETTLFLQSGADGTYGLVAVGYGTWQVSVVPPAPWHVTSNTPLSVFVDQANLLALGVDFCLADAKVTTNNVFLPSSGASANSAPFVMAILLGLVLFAAGFFVRRHN